MSREAVAPCTLVGSGSLKWVQGERESEHRHDERMHQNVVGPANDGY